MAWSSKRQPVVAKSTTEAEYIAADAAASEGVWFRYFLEELGLSLAQLHFGWTCCSIAYSHSIKLLFSLFHSPHVYLFTLG